MGRPIIDLTGQRFGLLAVIALDGVSDKGKARWSCRCDCGVTRAFASSGLRGGSATSCGCDGRRRISEARTVHGMAGSPTHISWSAMRSRCTNPNDPSFAEYAGRGIAVCEEWSAFPAFLADMGVRPAGMTLDRIDNEKGYSPDNCKWSTPKEQANNRRAPRITRGKILEAHEPGQIRWLVSIGQDRSDIARMFGIGTRYIEQLVREGAAP